MALPRGLSQWVSVGKIIYLVQKHSEHSLPHCDVISFVMALASRCYYVFRSKTPVSRLQLLRSALLLILSCNLNLNLYLTKSHKVLQFYSFMLEMHRKISKSRFHIEWWVWWYVCLPERYTVYTPYTLYIWLMIGCNCSAMCWRLRLVVEMTLRFGNDTSAPVRIFWSLPLCFQPIRGNVCMCVLVFCCKT